MFRSEHVNYFTKQFLFPVLMCVRGGLYLLISNDHRSWCMLLLLLWISASSTNNIIDIFSKTENVQGRDKYLVLVVTGPCSCGSSWIWNPSCLLVHSSLCGDAAQSWSSSGSLCLQDVWFHPISGIICTETYTEIT